MDETAGWGCPGWLPPTVRRSIALSDAADARQSRLDQAERERLAEEWHRRALAAYQEQCQARGEVVDVMAMARGEIPGRSVGDVLRAAVAAGDRQDVIDQARLHREGHGEPERLHIDFGEPVIHAPAARSATGFRVWQRTRRFQEWQQAKAEERARRVALESEFDHGLVGGGVTVRSRQDRDPLVVVSPDVPLRDGGR